MLSSIVGLLLAATVLGQLIQLRIFGLDIAPVDIALVISVILAGYQIFKQKIKPAGWSKDPVLTACLWFILAIVISLIVATPYLIFSQTALLVSWLYGARLIGYLLLLPLLASLADQEDNGRVHKLLAPFIWLMVLVGFVQLALFSDFRIFDHLGWDPHKGRLLGSFLDPNYTAVWFVAALLYLGTHPTTKNLLLGVAAFIAIILTVSRTGLIGLMGGIGVLAVSKLRWWAAAGLVFFAIIATMIPSINHRLSGVINLDTTVRYRLESWEGAANVIRQNPVFGVGYNTLKFRRYEHALPGTSRLVSRFEDGIIRPQQLTSRADAGFDSSLLTILATTGVVGLVSFLWLVWLISLRAWTVVKKVGITTNSGWVLGFTATLLLSSWFVNAWLYPPILILWIVSVILARKEWKNE